MKKIIKQLILFYLIFVVIKTILSYFIPAPSAFSDNYVYLKMARSFFYDFNFVIHGFPTHQYPPLYPIVLSLSYLLQDMRLVYFFMKFINVVVSSLIIFPTFLLAKQFLTEKKSLLVAILVSVIPSNFSFSGYIMSENLFYPLFLFTLYFIYKSFREKSYLYDVLAGVFLGLTFLTRINAVILIAVIFIVLFYKLFKKDYFELKKKLVLFFASFLVVLPWFIRNIVLFGFSSSGVAGQYYSKEALVLDTFSKLCPFITWNLLYLAFIIIGAGIFFPLMSVFVYKKFKDKNFFLFFLTFVSTIFFTLIVAANHNLRSLKYIYNVGLINLAGRPLGRYVDVILPLIFILGFIGYDIYKKNKNVCSKFLSKALIVFLLLFIFSSQLFFFKLYPLNNMSLTWLGILKYFLDFLISNQIISFVLLTLLIVSFLFLFFHIRNLDFKKIFLIFFLFFFLLSLANYTINYYNSNEYWYNTEQTKLALWFNDYDKGISRILFDERDCGTLDKFDQEAICGGRPDSRYTVMGFWMNNDIVFGNVSDVDYIVSRHDFDYPILNQTENGIFIYEVN